MQNLGTQADLARLFIPGHDNPEAAVMWCWLLIKKEKIFPPTVLDDLKYAVQGSRDETTMSRLVRAARSEEVLLNEVELTNSIVSFFRIIPESYLSSTLQGGKNGSSAELNGVQAILGTTLFPPVSKTPTFWNY